MHCRLACALPLASRPPFSLSLSRCFEQVIEAPSIILCHWRQAAQAVFYPTSREQGSCSPREKEQRKGSGAEIEGEIGGNEKEEGEAEEREGDSAECRAEMVLGRITLRQALYIVIY